MNRRAPRSDSAISKHFHVVRYYEDAGSLCEIVAGFLGDGLVSGAPAIIIATAPHRDLIMQDLARLSLDTAELERIGDLVLLDAEETLSKFMRLDGPDPVRFRRILGEALSRLTKGRQEPEVRAYGEMVDVLWRSGQPQAAIKLEILWNQLAATHEFRLLCGYAVGNFYKSGGREEINRLHSHVQGEDLFGEAAASGG